jgi:2-oxoglutarate ferredoxin oxidoreductase subunit beta
MSSLPAENQHQTPETVSAQAYASSVKPTWCPGCGNYGILTAVKTALASLGIPPHQAMLVSGIGCGSKLPDYTSAYGYLTIHGRPLPIATGIKLANHDLTVLVTDGDGDAYGIGGNHLIHTMRRNIDITHIVQNNEIYALTKGQYSPATPHGRRTTTSPEGVIEKPVRPMALGLAMGATFLARGFAGEPRYLADLLIEAIRHKGYALVDVLQPCVVFNKTDTYEWYKEHTYRVEDEGHDPGDFEQAMLRARQWSHEALHETGPGRATTLESKIPLGIIYRQPDVPTYESQEPALRAGPLIDQPFDGRKHDFEALKSTLM